MRRAVYAGTFDPPTNGHLWMIEQAQTLFDRVIVAIGVNPEKKTRFSLEERKAMLEHITAPYPHVEVASFENRYLIDYALEKEASCIVRGIRTHEDYAYERLMRNVNEDISREVTTVFLMPPRHLCEVSSSLVRGLVGPDGWEDVVKHYVPQHVLTCLKERNAS